MIGKDDFREEYFRDHYINHKDQGGPEMPQRKSGRILLGALVVAAIGAITYNLITNNTEEPTSIKAEGFPKGYHIENVDIDTRGKIVRVEKLPGEEYQKTVDNKTGMITFKGNFEYEIKPLRSAAPHLDHSDIHGNDLDNSKYWSDVRPGTVVLHKDFVNPESLEGKVNK